MASNIPKLTARQQARLLYVLGNTMQREGLGAISGLCAMFANAHGSPGEQGLVRKLAYRLRCGRVFDLALQQNRQLSSQRIAQARAAQSAHALATELARRYGAAEVARAALAPSAGFSEPQSQALQKALANSTSSAQSAAAIAAAQPNINASNGSPSALAVFDALSARDQESAQARASASANGVAPGSQSGNRPGPTMRAPSATDPAQTGTGSGWSQSTAPVVLPPAPPIPPLASDPTYSHRFESNGLAQESQRLKAALAARTMTRTVRECDHGELDRANLARIGAGITLRPYADRTAGRSIDSAVYLLVDVSGSMGSARMEPVCRAAWQIARACADSRAQFYLGQFNSNVRTLVRPGSPLAATRAAINGLISGGDTNCESAVAHATSVLAQSRAKRRILVVLSDGDTVATDPAWRDATARGIDWRLVSIGQIPQNVSNVVDLWRGRYAVVSNGPEAARTMLSELRTMLDKGARESC